MASKAAIGDTQRAKLERKEKAILTAARAVFVDNGFDGARMSEIAKRAGIGEGTIYSYYESKAELMLAVLQQFWDGLTHEARDVIARHKSTDVMDQMRVLARYHLEILVDNADFINLTFALRRNNSEVSVSREHLRQYVAVFDDIFRRGQDRGAFRGDAALWQARDVFYGSLEYSARSIEAVRNGQGDQRDPGPVVENMIDLFRSHYGQENGISENAGIDARLDQIEAKLDQLLA